MISVSVGLHLKTFHETGSNAVAVATSDQRWDAAMRIVQQASDPTLPNSLGNATFWYPVDQATNHPFRHVTAVIGGVIFSEAAWKAKATRR